MPSAYFTNLLELLKTEREADLLSYLKLTQASSAAERRTAGLSWYPVAIRNTEMVRGDYLSVELERTTHHELSHQFRFGASAVLFSNHDAKNNRAEGIISFQGGNRLKITLRTDELPDWASDGKLGVDLLFDNNSYDEMQNALKQADRQLESERLIQILVGGLHPSGMESDGPYQNSSLNQSQQEAVNKILSSNELSIVHGPPGTGKTTTLVQAIRALHQQDGKQILVVAPSNTAVDLLSAKLAAEGMDVLRVGNPARVSEKLMMLTLDGKMSAHPAMKDLKKLKKQASEYKNMAHKYKRSFGRAEQEQRKALFAEAHKIMKEVAATEQFITDDLVARAQVITATLVGANHYTVKNLQYHTLVIDEAGQALEPACWIPILKAKKLVMAGDPFQLSPTVKSELAARNGLHKTLLEKCIEMYPESVTLLREQYRMNEAIMGYSSRVFYHGLVNAHESVANRLLFPGDVPVSFIDTAGCGFDERAEGTSTSNPDEAALLFRHLGSLLNEYTDAPQGEFPSIAIISPYKEQIILLAELLQQWEGVEPFRRHIAVNTIDSFQGRERDVVYISMTRSNDKGDIGFLSDIRRMNVAMTRAKKKLVVIGDSATLCRLPFYTDFIGYVEKAGGYQSAWEHPAN